VVIEGLSAEFVGLMLAVELNWTLKSSLVLVVELASVSGVVRLLVDSSCSECCLRLLTVAGFGNKESVEVRVPREQEL